jgi:hypothetical protein
MKKYLMAGALALFCNIFLTGCGEDLDNYGSLEEAKKAQFAQNFEKFYGKISPTQDWGFGDATVSAARARTRGTGDNSCGTCIKPDMTNYPSANAPADITDYERQYVKNWFETHPGFTSGLNISNFYVQHVYGEASKPYKVWYDHYDQNYMTNHPGATSDTYRDDYWDNGTIDYLCVGDGTNYTHLNDFNSNDAGTNWKTIYMENSSALSFKYHCSWSSEEFTYFKCAEIDVPGVGKGCYVGMCMYGHKYDNGDRWINKEPWLDEYADDWIVKVIPGSGNSISVDKTTKVYKKKTVVVHKWVFCEDLGSSASNKDYDYNDLVFDAKIIDECKVVRDADGNETAYTDDPSHTYYAEVTPLAAGGELTIKFDKFNTSVHGMFASGIADNVLINTCGENQTIAASHQERLLASTQNYTFSSESEADINNIEVLVRTQTAVYDLAAYKGEAPHKICVPAGTRWAYERTDIKDAYTGFTSYVGGGDEPWSTTGVDANLYPLEGAAYDMKTDKTGTVSYEEISSSTTTTYDYTLADAANEHELWTGNVDFGNWNGNNNVTISAADLSAAEIGNGTVIRIYGVSNGAHEIKAIYKWNDDPENPDLGDSNWITGNDKNHYSASKVNGCITLTLNSTTAENFKNIGMILYGDNFRALCVTYDNSNKTTSSGGSGSGSAFWSSTNYGYQQLISTDDLNNAGIDSSKSMTVKITGTPLSWGWGEIKVLKDWTTLVTAKHDSTPQYAHFDENPGYVAIPVSASQVQEILATSGLRIEINNFNTTKVELMQ